MLPALHTVAFQHDKHMSLFCLLIGYCHATGIKMFSSYSFLIKAEARLINVQY